MDKDILTDFAIPNSEINAEMMVGEYGRLIIDVEVIGQVDGRTIFRKHGKAKADGNFRPESAKQMKARLLAQDDDAEDEDED